MVDAMSTLLLLTSSEMEPAGILVSIPGRVEAAATNPINAMGVPKLSAKGFNTGFFDIVELRIAKAPIRQRVIKRRLLNEIKSDVQPPYCDCELCDVALYPFTLSLL